MREEITSSAWLSSVRPSACRWPQPLKRPTVLAVAMAAPAIVWVACPAGVVGANVNGLLSAYSWKR